MSKSPSGHFKGTKGNIISLIRSLPKKPNKKFFEEWEDITAPAAKQNSESRVYKHKETGLEVRFDPAKEGANGFEGKDHWHVYNPNKTGKKDYYLDKDGNPVPKGSKASHIIPES